MANRPICTHPALRRAEFQGTGEPGPICSDCGAVVKCPHPRNARETVSFLGGDSATICRLCGDNL